MPYKLEIIPVAYLGVDEELFDIAQDYAFLEGSNLVLNIENTLECLEDLQTEGLTPKEQELLDVLRQVAPQAGDAILYPS